MTLDYSKSSFDPDLNGFRTDGRELHSQQCVARQKRVFWHCGAASGLRITRRVLPLDSWRDRRYVPEPGRREGCRNSAVPSDCSVRLDASETGSDTIDPHS